MRLGLLTATWVLAFSPALMAETEKVEFDIEELPTETVLPVFDKTTVVKNRNVSLSKRIELGLGLGLNMTEALYNNTIINLSGAYHFNEVHGFNIHGTLMNAGLSNMGNDLKEGNIIDSPLTFDPSRAPAPTYSVFGNYQVTAYYGKISLTKQTSMNLSLYGQAGLGTVAFEDSNSIGANLGFGQKLYFTDNLALRFDLRVLIYNGPDPTSPKDGVGGANKTLPNPGPDLSTADFDTTTYYHTHLTLGLTYLL